MKNSKPFFPQDVEDRLVAVIVAETQKQYTSVNESDLRKYIRAGKSIYENSLLRGVSDGKYLAMVQEGVLAFKPAEPTDAELDALMDKAKVIVAKENAAGKDTQIPSVSQLRAAWKQNLAQELGHSCNMVALYGTANKQTIALGEPKCDHSSESCKCEHKHGNTN